MIKPKFPLILDLGPIQELIGVSFCHLQILVSLPGWLNREGVNTSLLRLVGLSSTRGGRRVADARDQQPFERGNRGLRVILSGHFCESLHVGHARRIRLVFDYRITYLEAQIKKTNRQCRL